MMIIPNNNLMSLDGSRKVKVSDLEELGIKKGSVFNYVDFKTGKLHSYEFKDTVDFAPGYVDIGGSLTGYVILLRDVKEGEIIMKKDADTPTGIGYIGNQFKIQSYDPVRQYPTLTKLLDDPESVAIIDAQRQRYPNSKFQITGISQVKANETLFYRFDWLAPPLDGFGDDIAGNGLVWIKNKDQILNLSEHWKPSEVRPIYDFMNFIEGADWVLRKSGGGMHSCYDFIIHKDQKIFRVETYCDSGGC